MVLSFSILSILFLGCGNNGLAPVSGTVTYKGKPVKKLRLSFSPQPVGDNHAVGPFSSGTTDSAGKFTLKTRYDDKGAVIGAHSVTFEYSDIGETAMADLRADIDDAKESGSKEFFERTQKKIANLMAKLKDRPVLKPFEKVVDVPSGGHENLVIDLTEMDSE